jgi:S1-C subfamily serine protease
MTFRNRLLSAVVLVTLGVTGGLVLAGRLSLTSPSGAAPEQAAPRPAAPPARAAGGGPLPDLSQVADAALRVSANIRSTSIMQVRDPWFQFWYGDQVQGPPSLGSGVVVSPDGYILTNTHVIGSAGANVSVTMPDGSEQRGEVVGIDEVSDLAVVKVQGRDLETLPWGDSGTLRVAEWVLAVGNPFQLSGTVTLGIVSTVSRPGTQFGQYADFIQTDAAINPGNSGGALVNARGELIGINTMITSDTGNNVGIGFAIPANLARRIMTELIEHGAVRWGSIGRIDLLTMSPQVAARYGLRNIDGVLVFRGNRSSPALRAGLALGDIIVSMNGQPVTSAEQLDRMIIESKVGSTARFEIVRTNGSRAVVTVPIINR